MGHYYGRGDYYRGDYYRGDFLGLGHAFKSLVGTVGKFALGAAEGLPIIGPAVKAGEAIVRTVQAGAHPSLPQPKMLAITAGRVALPGPGPQGGLVNVGPPGTPQYGLVNVTTGTDMLPAGRAMKGYHVNKSTYETRGGGTSRWPQELELHTKGTVLVRNRRMNVGNARALKRALRRAGGFARLARRVMSFTHPRAGRGHFKFKRRAKR